MEKKDVIIGFGKSTVTISEDLSNSIWFDEYNFGMDGRKLKEIYDAYNLMFNYPHGFEPQQVESFSSLEDERDSLQNHIQALEDELRSLERKIYYNNNNLK